MASAVAYEDDRCGALVADTTVHFTPDSGHPIGYYSQEQVDGILNLDLKWMVDAYEPAIEFVLGLLKSGDRATQLGTCALDYIFSTPSAAAGA